jgi:phosphate transport system substrate-binding protein
VHQPKQRGDLDVNRSVLTHRFVLGIASVAVAAITVAGCGSDKPNSTGSGPASEYASLTGSIKGSGSSFQNAFEQKTIDEFTTVAENTDVVYNSVGSGTGKKEFGSGLTDFAGTDSLVKDSDGVAAGSFYYIPLVAAPITVSYNLSGVPDLKLSGETLGGIFSRQIKTWNDPKIAADNPGVTMPSTPIVVAHRSDGSGTTNQFTKYLVAAGGSAWTLGSGDSVAWPADTQGGEKNTGVAQIIKQSDGAIGYVDFADAVAGGLKFASIKNKDGQFVAPSLDGATAALSVADVQADLTFNPINMSGAAAYPITAPTYLLVKTSYSDATKAKLVKAYVKYMLTTAQGFAASVNFAKLPDSLQQKALAQLNKVQG